LDLVIDTCWCFGFAIKKGFLTCIKTFFKIS
jgi:hypothetical protein